ncbi:hypothetical protein ACFQT0_14360 [Hymenobacter humi]|uniref:Viral A-type inclusion protein n=1 Tax=Hymenobacter humi TaxID=1411620 RepID=A0ABW2U4L9_9BACT
MKFYQKKALQALLLALAPALAACPSAAPPRQVPPAQAAEKALMARHDSLMAKMDQLYTLKATINKAHSPAAGPYLRGLAAADAAMMDWMHQYRAPDTTAAPAARLAYFQQQQQVLAGVSQQFRATIDSATLFIRQLPTAQSDATAPAPTK